jgi:hypothetical protein
MKQVYIFTLAVVLCSSMSCKKDESPSNIITANDFIPIPLNVGNTWIYDHTNSSGTHQDTFSISGTATLNGESGFTLSDDWLFDNDGGYYKGGILYGCKTSSPSTTTEIVFPKNPSVGQTWSVDGKAWKLEATNISITVPAGTFSCYKVSIAEATPFDIYLADGKGIIKTGEMNESEHSELRAIQIR